MKRYPDTVFDDRLDRCKHCGSAAIVEGPENHESGSGFLVMCDGNADCMIQTQECPTLEEALAAWNRCPSDSKNVHPEIEVLELALDFIDQSIPWKTQGGRYITKVKIGEIREAVKWAKKALAALGEGGKRG